MTATNKTYINSNEYELYRHWWVDNYNKMIKELNEPIYLYTFWLFGFNNKVTPEVLKKNKSDVIYYENRYKFPIWDTSEKQDLWLVKNCDIASYRKRLLEIYPKTWKGFKGCTWVIKNNTK